MSEERVSNRKIHGPTTSIIPDNVKVSIYNGSNGINGRGRRRVVQRFARDGGRAFREFLGHRPGQVENFYATREPMNKENSVVHALSLR